MACIYFMINFVHGCFSKKKNSNKKAALMAMSSVSNVDELRLTIAYIDL